MVSLHVSLYSRMDLSDGIAGFYVSLFVMALNVMLRRQTLDTTSSRVFLTGIIAMFLIITFHNGEPVRRFGWQRH